ncbi:MAG: DUF4861 domain-containing protein [Ignavibacteriae bacterium]|nr:DUF4861 domain-containing protein [Ignavibacteriota bacterium]
MKKNVMQIAILFFLSVSIYGQSNFTFYKAINVDVKNESNIARTDELVSINVNKLKSVNDNFNKDAYIVFENEKEIASQLYNDGFDCSIIFVTNFLPNQSKIFTIKYLENGKLRRDYKSRTYAELAMKFNSEYKNKKFTDEPFQNFTKVVVPKVHTDHDALFKYEGPGWESEKVGYRFYLDWRNATDIFGKNTDELILHKVGNNDRIATDDSYHEMQEWGMDIFKVGKTLGIGSLGMMHADSIYMVSKTDEVICEIDYNGPILSEIKTNYKGWQVGKNKYDLVSKFSIAAGSRITNVDLSIYGNAENITTGLAKYPDTDFIASEGNGDWQYIALYGKQTLNNDNVGIVLFYKKSELIEKNENTLNYYVTLKPNNNKVNYAFAAAWEKELNGIKTKSEFIKYIDEEIIKLNNPLNLELK